MRSIEVGRKIGPQSSIWFLITQITKAHKGQSTVAKSAQWRNDRLTCWTIEMGLLIARPIGHRICTMASQCYNLDDSLCGRFARWFHHRNCLDRICRLNRTELVMANGTERSMIRSTWLVLVAAESQFLWREFTRRTLRRGATVLRCVGINPSNWVKNSIDCGGTVLSFHWPIAWNVSKINMVSEMKGVFLFFIFAQLLCAAQTKSSGWPKIVYCLFEMI